MLFFVFFNTNKIVIFARGIPDHETNGVDCLVEREGMFFGKSWKEA